MTSVQALREFVNERLTAAAAEILTVVERTIVQYEEKIDRQCRLLDVTLNPQIKLHRIELPQHNDCSEEHLFEQETNNCIKHVEPEPPENREEALLPKDGEGPELLQIKEEPESPQIREEPQPLKIREEPESPKTEEPQEPSTSQGGERLVPSIEEQSFLSEGEEVPDTEQFLSRDSEVHHLKNHIDSESAINAELKESSIVPSDRVDDVPVSENQAQCEKPLCEETLGGTVNNEPKLHQKLGDCMDKTKMNCKICGKRYSRMGFFVAHMKTHKGENQSECEKLPCEEKRGETVSEKHDLYRKLGILDDEKKFSCEFCDKSYSRKSFLMAHMRVHKGEKPAECEKPPCVETRSRNAPEKQETQQNQTKKSPQKVQTATGKKMFSCVFCGRTYTRLETLLDHVRTHTGEKPYCCEVCGNNYRRRDSLVIHMRTHTGERPFSCDTCGKGFRVRGQLILHNRIHTGERPHSCDICRKSFSLSNHLVTHMRSHTGERPYSCQVCGKCFRVRHSVKVHMRSHTGERPFPCQTCGKRFAVRSHLLEHIQTHAGERPYVCQLCAKTFGVHSSLRRHMKTHRDQASFL